MPVTPPYRRRRRPETSESCSASPSGLLEQLHERFAERGHTEVRAPHGNVLQFLDDAGSA